MTINIIHDFGVPEVQRHLLLYLFGLQNLQHTLLQTELLLPELPVIQYRGKKPPASHLPVPGNHQQKNIPFGWNGSIRVDALRQSRQRHPSGGLLRARRQYNVLHCISPSDRCFNVSSRSVGLLF
jgi:hypothetical protein